MKDVTLRYLVKAPGCPVGRVIRTNVGAALIRWSDGRKRWHNMRYLEYAESN